MNIAIVGLGLIGGSFALALKKRFEDLMIYGWDISAGHRKQALDLKIVDRCCESLDDAIQKADWIILAVPVNAIEELVSDVLDRVHDGQVVIDFGSTKRAICGAVENHPRRAQFIAAHPISGTEYSGPGAAFDSLYENKVMIVCEKEKTHQEHLDSFRKQCKVLGMTTTYLSSEEHDIHLAYVSHLSHAISFGLSRAVLEKEESADTILDLAGSGFASTVRLAKSSPEMWTPIFLKNRESVLESLDSYMKWIGKLRDLIDQVDGDGIQKYLEEGRAIRKILD